MSSSGVAVPKGDQHHPSSSDTNNNKDAQAPPPKLLHPALEQIPMEIRFGILGAINNVLFMILYNQSIGLFHDKFEAATIYAVVYFFFIPLGHFNSCLLVFGWPDNYVQNLLSNYPIGLSAIVLGSALTAYLDDINFNDRAETFVNDYILGKSAEAAEHEEGGEFYSSLVTMIVTGVFSFLASKYVNTPSAAAPTSSSDDKKEL